MKKNNFSKRIKVADRGEYTVLIVEDELPIALMERKVLEKAGFKTKTSRSGREALKQIKESKIDLVLLDHKLPDISGSKIVRTISNHINPLPVVIVTAFGDEELAVDMFRIGIVDYVIKDENLNFINSLPEIVHLQIENKMMNREIIEKVDSEIKLAYEEIYLFKDLVNKSNDAIFVIELETGCFLDVNDQACSSLKYSREELLNKKVTDIEKFMPDSSIWGKHVEEVKERGYMIIEGVHTRKDGTVFPVEVNVKSTTHHDKHYLVAVARDITERKHAEEKLRESEVKYSILAATSPVGMWQSDANGYCIYMNERCSEIMGLTVEEVIEKGWVWNLHPEDKDRVYAEWYETVSNKQSFKSEYRFLLPNGKMTWVYGQATPEIDKDGIVVGYVGTITDITEHKKDQEQIKAALKEREVLLKEVHHRVKNNMQVISSLLNLQSRNVEDKQLQGILTESQNRIKSMALIHEEFYQTKNLAEIDFAGYVKTLARRLISIYETNPDDIMLEINVDNVFLGIDNAIPCGLILNELISNSLKHAFFFDSDQGKPESKKREVCITFNCDKSKLILLISDNGIGIPKDIDFRNAKTMGLSLVNTLTDQIDGTIALDRSKGTLFKIVF